MDFTTEQYSQALNGFATLTGSDQSALSGLPDSAKSQYIATKIGGVLNSQDVTTYPNGDINNPVVEASARTQAKDTLQGALTSRTPATANSLRDMGMAHYVWMQQNGIQVPNNISFAHSEDDLSGAEVEALEGIVRYYDTNNTVQLQNDFSRASATQTYTEQRAQLDQIDAANRAADIAYAKQGMQILGYIPDDVALDAITPEQLREAMLQYSADASMGLQVSGAAVDYARGQYGVSNIHMQRQALYEGDSAELIDSTMARKMVEAGLDTQNGLPATLTGPGGGVNYSAVYSMAERGGLLPVPDEYLSDDQRAIFDALGGQTSAEGQTYLRDMIANDNGEWYAEGLKLRTEPALEIPAAAVIADAEVAAIDAGIITNEQTTRHQTMAHETYTAAETLAVEHEELVAASYEGTHGEHFDTVYDKIAAGEYVITADTPPELARLVELQGNIPAAEQALTSYQTNSVPLNTQNEWGIHVHGFTGAPYAPITDALENNIVQAQNGYMEYYNGLNGDQLSTVVRTLNGETVTPTTPEVTPETTPDVEQPAAVAADELSPAQIRQNELSASANENGAMQSYATGLETRRSLPHENPNMSTADPSITAQFTPMGLGNEQPQQSTPEGGLDFDALRASLHNNSGSSIALTR